MTLSDKHCIPCAGGTPPMPRDEAEKLLKQLKSDWSLNSKGHLEATYKFPNFVDSMSFANKVGELAEAEGHHPFLAITWGFCGIEIWTHKINGLTESDFVLAAKIDTLSA